MIFFTDFLHPFFNWFVLSQVIFFHSIHLVFFPQLSLRDNPLVVRFVSDMTHNPPSLLELAARVVKTSDIRYDNETIPYNLVQYLNSAHHCVNLRCKGQYLIKSVHNNLAIIIILDIRNWWSDLIAIFRPIFMLFLLLFFS